MNNEQIDNAIDFAFSNKVAEMSSEIEKALEYKIINALEQKRIEMAMNILNKENVSEAYRYRDKEHEAQKAETGRKFRLDYEAKREAYRKYVAERKAKKAEKNDYK